MDNLGAQGQNELFLGCNELVWAEDRLHNGHAVVCSARAPDKEGENEDGAAVLRLDSGESVLAVADGVGGQPAAHSASGLALRTLREALRENLSDGGSLREAILSGFDRANRAVLALGTGSATTLAAVEVYDGRIRSYHVGDSGALVFGGRGRVRLQTISQSPVGYALEAGVMDEQEAMEHEDRHLVSNVIGDSSMHVVMSSPVKLRPRDTVVVASDGLFDNAYTEEIVEYLRRGSLEAGANALMRECRQRMRVPQEGVPSKPDDLTLIAYRPS